MKFDFFNCYHEIKSNEKLKNKIMDLDIDINDRNQIWNCITQEIVIVIDNQWLSEMFHS